MADKITAINVKANNIQSPEGKTVELKTRRIGSGKSGKIKVQGTFRVSGAVIYTPPTIDLAASPFAATSFLETGETPHQPWRRILYDTFDHDENDWVIKDKKENDDENTVRNKETSLSHCGDHNLFLGGYCNAGGNHVMQKSVEISSTPHTEVRIVAKVHLIDSWENEMVWMSIDDHIVWTTTGAAVGNIMSICGNPSHNEASLGITVDVTVPHTKKYVNIQFGASLDEHECNESLGLDDVQLYVH